MLASSPPSRWWGVLLLAGGNGLVTYAEVLAAALSWAIGSWLSPRVPMPTDVASGTTFELLFGGAVIAVLGEAVTVTMLIGGAIIVAAVALVIRAEVRASPAPN